MVDLHFTRTPSEWLETDFLLESIDICWAEAVRGKLESKKSFFFPFQDFRISVSKNHVTVFQLLLRYRQAEKKKKFPRILPL